MKNMEQLEADRLKKNERWRKVILITLWTEKVNKKRNWLGVLEIQKKCRFPFHEQVEPLVRDYIPQYIEEVRFYKSLIGYRVTKAGEEKARAVVGTLVRSSNALGSSLVRRALTQELDKLRRLCYNVPVE